MSLSTIESPYVPSEIWQHHVLPELTPDEIIDSVCGVDEQLTDEATLQITQIINNEVPLKYLFEKPTKLDKFFRALLGHKHPITHLDYTGLDEHPLYFISISGKLTTLRCNDPIEDEELEKLAILAERRKLKHLKELELSFFQIDRLVNLLCLKALFSVTKITSLTLRYSPPQNEDFDDNILKFLPNHLKKLVLHNANLTIKKINIFKSKKFENLTHLDLSYNSLLNSSALSVILESQLPKLENLILNQIGKESFPSEPSVKQVIPLNLKAISLYYTYLRNPAFFIEKFKELKSLNHLSISFLTIFEPNIQSLKFLLDSQPNLKLFVFYKES